MGIRIDPERLRYWRDVRLMSRIHLAAAARMSYDSVVSYELGRRLPGQSALRRLCASLGIGPEDVVLEPEKKPRKAAAKED